MPAPPSCLHLFNLPQPHTRPILLTALPPPPLSPHCAADAAGVAAAAASADLAPLRTYLAAARCADFAIAPDMEQFLQQGEPGLCIGVCLVALVAPGAAILCGRAFKSCAHMLPLW